MLDKEEFFPLPSDLLAYGNRKGFEPALQRGQQNQTTFEAEIPTTVECVRNQVSSSVFHQKWGEDQPKSHDTKTSVK